MNANATPTETKMIYAIPMCATCNQNEVQIVYDDHTGDGFCCGKCEVEFMEELYGAQGDTFQAEVMVGDDGLPF